MRFERALFPFCMWHIHTYDELPSTQTLARDLLNHDDAVHGDVFSALHQTAGRGQYRSRTWLDEPSANLLLSIVLTEIPQGIGDLMQFVTGLGVLHTVRPLITKEVVGFDPQRVRLKWPNDILIDMQKASGILSEAIWSGSTLKGVILGIGMNVNQHRFPPEVTGRAISIRNIIGFAIPIDTVRDKLLAQLQQDLTRYHDRQTLLNDLRDELAWLKELGTITVSDPSGNSRSSGIYKDITDTAAIVIEHNDGSYESLNTVSITLP